MLQDQMILESCPCCRKPTITISLREAQSNHFKTQREKRNKEELRHDTVKK